MLINNAVITLLLQNSSPSIAEALTIRKPTSGVRVRVAWLYQKCTATCIPPGSRILPMTRPRLTWGCWRQQMQLRINVYDGC